jgi:hypothetical protein
MARREVASRNFLGAARFWSGAAPLGFLKRPNIGPKLACTPPKPGEFLTRSYELDVFGTQVWKSAFSRPVLGPFRVGFRHCCYELTSVVPK